jgi:hypothetical protein
MYEEDTPESVDLDLDLLGQRLEPVKPSRSEPALDPLVARIPVGVSSDRSRIRSTASTGIGPQARSPPKTSSTSSLISARAASSAGRFPWTS